MTKRLLSLENDMVSSVAIPTPRKLISERHYSLKETRKEIIDVHLNIMTDVRKYNRQSCRDVCAMMQEKLPRELRDMVYSYISTFQDDQILNSEYKTWLAVDKGNAAYVNQHHVWDTSWVGHKTRNEIVENYYRTSQRFIAYTWYMAKSCLMFDPWKINAVPAHLITKSLEICMDFDDQVPPGILQIMGRIPLSTKIEIRIFTEGLICAYVRSHEVSSWSKNKLESFHQAWFPIFKGLSHRKGNFRIIIAFERENRKTFNAQDGDITEKIKEWLEERYCKSPF